LEGIVRSINCDGNWATFDGAGETGFGTGGDVLVGGNGGTHVGGVVFAGVGSGGCVAVGLFSVNTVIFDDIFECLVHPSTIATLVTFGGGAINQILFGKAHKRTRFKEMSVFFGSCCVKRLAISSLSLILNSSDGTFCSPVNSGSGGFTGNVNGLTGDIHSIVK